MKKLTLFMHILFHVIVVSLAIFTICKAQTIATGDVYGLLFNSNTDYVEVAHKNELNLGSGDFTFEAWIKPIKKRQKSYTILSKRDPNKNGFLVGLNETGQLFVELGPNELLMDPGPPLFERECHHIAITRLDEEIAFYIDGNKTSNAHSNRNLDNTEKLIIGRENLISTDKTFYGNMEDVRIWNVHRTQEQIFENRVYLKEETGLVGRWKMNDGSGQIVKDHSPNMNDGQLGSRNRPIWEISECCRINAGFAVSNHRPCLGDLVSFTNMTVTRTRTRVAFKWSVNGVLKSTDTDFSYLFDKAGTYTVELWASEQGCQDKYSSSFIIEDRPKPVANAGEDVAIYRGQNAFLGTLPVRENFYKWEPTTFLNNPNSATPIVKPNYSKQYVLTVTDQYGCYSKDIVQVTVKPGSVPDPSDTIPGSCGYSPSKVVELNRERAALPHYLKALAPQPVNRSTCGRFNLIFEDETFNTEFGFDERDPIGANRRDCACDVFTYISSVIDIAPGTAKIDILFKQSIDSATSQRLAEAGTYYPPAFNTTPGIYNGNLYDYIKTGIDPDTSQYDAAVTVNFGHTDINSCALPKVACEYDLYSILLHEVTHALGWGSLIVENPIDPDKKPISSGSNNQFTLYDRRFLFYSLNINGPFNQIIDSASPNTNPSINSFFQINNITNPLRADKIWLYNNSSNINQPIYSRDPSPNPYKPGTALSHFDSRYMLGRNHDAPGFVPNYLMSPELQSWQLKREYTMQELRALQTLGYTIKSTLPQFAYLGNHPPYVDGPVITQSAGDQNAYDETLTGLNPGLILPTVDNCTSLPIDLGTLAVLHDNDGDPIQIFPNSLFNIRGCGINGNNHDALNITSGGGSNGSDIITFIPRDNFIGLVTVQSH